MLADYWHRVGRPFFSRETGGKLPSPGTGGISHGGVTSATTPRVRESGLRDRKRCNASREAPRRTIRVATTTPAHLPGHALKTPAAVLYRRPNSAPDTSSPKFL